MKGGINEAVRKDGIYRAMGERELRVGEWNSGREWNVESWDI
jgi:hypothetical protein